jgi:hypothetical protein
MRRHPLPIALACVALLLGAGRTAPLAADPTAAGAPADCADAACVVRAARARTDAGVPRDAVAALKEARDRFPGDDALTLALAEAYLASDNPFWAIRTLESRRAAGRDDCAGAALLAWAFVGQAALDRAEQTLAEAPCDAAPPADRARLAMVRALVASAGGRGGDAQEAAVTARAAERVYPSDRAALPDLLRRVAPDVAPDVAWRLEATAGYTTNALLGSPIDPTARPGDAASGLLLVDAWARFAPWLDAPVRPLVEGQVKVARYFEPAVSGLSYADFGGRVGLTIGESLPRALLAYRPGLLLLDQGDRYEAGPVLYYESHRGELEVEIAPWLMVFGGAGQRWFRESARTRFEVDLGLGGALPPLLPRTGILWALSGRAYRAADPAYHLFGGSALLSVQVRLPLAFLVRLSGSASVDTYPDSRGYPVFFLAGERKQREEVFGKATATLWSPTWRGLRVGLAYEFSRRDSTAGIYDFTDHRALVRIGWSGDAFALLPGGADEPAAARIDWGVAGAGGGLEDRLQDLLRQDEAVQRASSCVQ